MKLKFLLPTVLFLYCFNSFAQDNLKSPQSNNGNSNLSTGGCNGMDVLIYASVSPFIDSIVSSWPFHIDSVYISSNDSVRLHGNWDSFNCGPIDHAIWFKDSVAIDTNYYTGWTLDTYRMVYQPGLYYAILVRTFTGFMQRNTPLIEIIDTSSTTSISNQNNPDLNISVIKNKIIVQDLLEKGNLLLSVYDLTGRSIFNKEIISPASSFEIEIPSLPDGLYMLNLKNKNFNFLKKFNSNNF